MEKYQIFKAGPFLEYSKVANFLSYKFPFFRPFILVIWDGSPSDYLYSMHFITLTTLFLPPLPTTNLFLSLPPLQVLSIFSPLIVSTLLLSSLKPSGNYKYAPLILFHPLLSPCLKSSCSLLLSLPFFCYERLFSPLTLVTCRITSLFLALHKKLH